MVKDLDSALSTRSISRSEKLDFNEDFISSIYY